MKQLTGNKTINTLLKICSFAAVAAAAFIGIVYFKADIKTLIVFPLFLLFYVLIPGALVIDSLGLRSEYASSTFVRSFFTGFALQVIFYYLSTITGTDIPMLILGPVLSVIWLIRFIRNGPGEFFSRIPEKISTTPASFFVFLAFVFLFSFLTTQYVYISPEFSAFSYIKIDFAYHAGIIDSLTDGYPPADPWVAGFSILYHFFSEMLLSIPAKLFGLTPEDLLMTGTPMLVAPLLSFSLYGFFMEFSQMKERAGLYCLALHFSNMFILKEFPNSWFLYHVYSNINNAGLGIACLLTVLPLLKAFDTKENSRKESFLIAILIMLMTGIKGPVSIVLIGGMIGTVILGLIMRKVSGSAIWMTALSSISFILIFVFVLGSQHSNTSGGSILNPGEVTDIFFLKGDIMDAMGGMPKIASWLVVLAAFTVIFFTAFLLPFIVGYLRELILVLSGRKEFCFSRITIYAVCLVGFFSTLLLDFSGHSQVYFGFVAAMLTPMIVFWYFEDMHGSKAVSAKTVRAVFAVCLCLTACTSMLYMYKLSGKAYRYAADPDKNRDKYKNVSAAEYEGLIWIRDNTPEDSLIASDRYFSVDPAEYNPESRSNNTHFAYAVYSQRCQYLEGSGFSMDLDDIYLRVEMIRTNKELYDPENEDRGDLARSLDVDYVVVSKRYDDAAKLENKDYELCFSNEGMDIYEIKEAS